LSIRAPLVSRELKPPRRFCAIVLLVVQMAQLVLGVRASLVRSEAVSLHGLGMVLYNALAKVIQQAEIDLSDGKTLLGERTIMPKRCWESLAQYQQTAIARDKLSSSAKRGIGNNNRY
jgi:hypothetical protein